VAGPANADSESSWAGLVDIHAVADRLGVQIRHVRRLVHERRIPYVKWGRLLRFDADEIDAWIDSVRVPTTGGHQPR
jgi:excisionase family DNA binding protein